MAFSKNAGFFWVEEKIQTLFSSQTRASSRVSMGISWAPQSALKYDRHPVLENLQLLKARVNYPSLTASSSKGFNWQLLNPNKLYLLSC